MKKVKETAEDSVNAKLTHRLFPVRNRRGDVTKTRLIQATMEFILECGVESVTFDAVGQRERMSAAQVKYHFGDRSYLIEQTMKYAVLLYQECIIEAVKDKKGHVAQITALVDGTLDFVRLHPKPTSLFLLFFHSASVFPKYRELHSEMFAHGMNRMANILEAFGRKNRLSESEVSALGMAIWAMIDGLLLYAATTEGERSIEQMRTDSRYALKKLLS